MSREVQFQDGKIWLNSPLRGQRPSKNTSPVSTKISSAITGSFIAHDSRRDTTCQSPPYPHPHKRRHQSSAKWRGKKKMTIWHVAWMLCVFGIWILDQTEGICFFCCIPLLKNILLLALLETLPIFRLRRNVCLQEAEGWLKIPASGPHLSTLGKTDTVFHSYLRLAITHAVEVL